MATSSIFYEKTLNVVVDTNELVLSLLTLKVKSRSIYNGGKIICYNDPQAFLYDLKTFPASTNFFFGTYYGIGTTLTGADLAKAVKIKNKSSPVFVVTTEPEAEPIVQALNDGFIDAIFSKYLYYTEPHDNGQLTDDENKEFFALSEILCPKSDLMRRADFYYEKRPSCLQEIQKIKMKLSSNQDEAILKETKDDVKPQTIVSLLNHLKLFKFITNFLARKVHSLSIFKKRPSL